MKKEKPNRQRDLVEGPYKNLNQLQGGARIAAIDLLAEYERRDHHRHLFFEPFSVSREKVLLGWSPEKKDFILDALRREFYIYLDRTHVTIAEHQTAALKELARGLRGLERPSALRATSVGSFVEPKLSLVQRLKKWLLEK